MFQFALSFGATGLTKMALAKTVGRMLRIGELAKALGITTKTLRHYEKMGLITPSGRTLADYRVYDVEDQRRARNVIGLRSIGLSIPEIHGLFDAETSGQNVRQRLLGHLDEKLRETEETLSVLQGRRDDLAARSMSLFDTPQDRSKDCICAALMRPCDCP
jgi:DNA-binding transcriptional MerR regulator